jgi:hypothetical protein
MLPIFSIDAMIYILLSLYRWGVDHENCARLKYMECVSMEQLSVNEKWVANTH